MAAAQAGPSEHEHEHERDALIARVMAFEQAIKDIRLNETVDMLITIPLTLRQLKVLGVIMAGNGTVTSQHLAKVFHVSLATVSGLVDRLVEGKMVVRVPHEVDHRITNLSATDAGRTLVRDLMASANQIQHDALRSLSLQDLGALAQGLDALGVALVATQPSKSSDAGTD